MTLGLASSALLLRCLARQGRGVTLSSAALLLVLGCGGQTFTSTSDGPDGAAGAGDGGSGAAGTSSGGAPSSGGSSSGGSAGSGGAAGAGGGTAQCVEDADCPQPGAPCSAAYCVDATCVVEYTDGCGTGGGSGTACTRAIDCPQPPPVCNECPDGSFVCPSVDCIGGQCVVVNDACEAVSTSCPPGPPPEGSPCTAPAMTGISNDFAHCSWGDDPRTECRTTALCQDGRWWVTTPTQPHCSEPPLPPSCPSIPPAGTCEGFEPACWYDDGTRCFCSGCVGGSEYPVCQIQDPPQWYCQSPPVGCPPTTPQAGSSCIEEGLSCSPSCELSIVCEGGVWRWLQGYCPICAAPDTPIATPEGDRPISALRAGDLVYSVHQNAVVAVPVARASSTPVSRHRVVRVELESGAVLEISPGHPTADGRTFADLAAGVSIDSQHIVARVELVPYTHDRTYDILPASDTATYFAAGARIGSTLSTGAGVGP